MRRVVLPQREIECKKRRVPEGRAHGPVLLGLLGLPGHLQLTERLGAEHAAVGRDEQVGGIGPLWYWLGRAQEGVGLTADATGSYQEFLSLRPEDTPNALVGDSRQRLARFAIGEREAG